MRPSLRVSPMLPLPEILNLETYRQAIAELASRDPDLALVLSEWGEPPFWTQEAGFVGLVISILAQQVSLESAQAAFSKLEQAIGTVTPDLFLTLDDSALKQVGFSRQKASYVRGIASAILTGEVDLRALAATDNDLARQKLMELKGVGPWTADAYLLFSLCRADAWPTGDLALIKAIQDVRGLPAPLEAEEADAIADQWRPWRGVAARMLWFHYLSARGRLSSA